MNKPLVIGHRGAPKEAPENTLQSFERAIAIGVDMIELDLRESADGHIIIIHDADVSHVSDGTGMVTEMNLSELKSLDLGSGALIPTLDEVLEMVNGRVMLNLEIKVPGMEERILSSVKKFNMKNKVIYSSFFHLFLIELKEVDDSVEIAILYEMPIDAPARYAKDIGASAINPAVSLLEPEIVKDAHELGLKVFPWVINDEKMIKKMLKFQVDGIISDRPDLCKAVIDHII